jgi:hypothetical protein
VTARTKPNGNAVRSPRERLRVGVTLYVRDEQQTIWENGIFQNSFFLLSLLKKAPVVEWSCLVAGGPGDPANASDLMKHADAEIISMTEAMERLDVVIELSAQLDVEWAKTFVERGGRIIAMRVANDFVIDAERMAFGLPPGLLMSGSPYEEVWTLPAFSRTCAGYYAAGYRAPVREMQHLWAPTLLERAVAERGGAPFEYVPGRERWRVGVLEANICSVKTCHVPLLVTDVAYRLRPSAFENLRVFNASSIRDNDVFIRFARSTELVRSGLATFEARYAIWNVLGEMIDAVVSHHWENGQNYLYYETLYGGFPLIHNSDLIEGCGYRYSDFDPQDGGRALLQAVLEHDRSLGAYRANARRLLAKLDPTSDENVRVYSDAIWNAYHGNRGEGSLTGALNTPMEAA